MFRFESPHYLWLLLILVVLAFLRIYVWRRKRAQYRKMGDIPILKNMIPALSNKRAFLKFILLSLTIFVLIIALARPQMGSKISREKRNGIETIIALDISNSMNATDVSPSRLAKSKLLIENLIDNFTNDKIGLIIFAGKAYVQLPITNDFVSAKMFLQDISSDMITMQGTDIATAIEMSMACFSENSNIGKAIILITDGENHEGGAEEMAAKAKKYGIHVYILGVGTAQGAPIPDGNGGYLKDKDQNIVVTRLNEQMCQDLAKAGSGKYIHVDNTHQAQEVLNHELAKLQKGETESVVYSEYAEQFMFFVLLALILLILESVILEIKNPLFQRIKIFDRKKK